MLYLIVLSFHVIFVITWFAALFYLPRLFVYHAEANDPTGIDRFKVMERRLYNGILLPSSLLALLFGVWLVIPNWSTYVGSGWFWVKLVFVLLLFGYQGMASRYRKELAKDQSTRSPTFFRIFNELPVVILVVIVFLVILKPF